MNVEKAILLQLKKSKFVTDENLALKNQVFQAQANQRWFKVTVLPTEASSGSIGIGGYDIWNGLVQIDVFSPLGTGDDYEVLKSLVSTFPRSEQLDVGDFTLTIEKTWHEESQMVDGWQRTPFLIRWNMPVVTE